MLMAKTNIAFRGDDFRFHSAILKKFRLRRASNMTIFTRWIESVTVAERAIKIWPNGQIIA